MPVENVTGNESSETGVGDSILKTIRKMMGPGEDYQYFDTDLIIFINSTFSRLCQLGVGPEVPFRIQGTSEEWSDFIDDGTLEDVKKYIYLSVKIVFDPPANSTVLAAYQEEVKKLEWLLMETAAHGY